MLARDLSSGRLIAVPDSHVFASPLGGYRLGSYAPRLAHGVGSVSGFGLGAPPAQIIYDGLGHPLGLSFLTALPELAGRVAALLPRFATAASQVLPLLQSTSAVPQGQPAAMPASDMMVAPSMPPPMRPSMQAPLQSPIQPIQPTMVPAMEEPMQEPMHPPIQAAAQPLMPPSMASMAPPPEPGSAETVAPPERLMAPLRVQQGNGGSVVIPMPWRVRPRRRGRRFVPRRPAIPRPPFPPSGYGPGSAPPAPYLHGWSGFNGWSRY